MSDFPKGLDPYVSRQYLLHHMYSPLVSIEASPSAETLVQSVLDSTDISLLSVFKPYGNNVKYPTQNQLFKITNSQLISKSYPSFPIRFDFPLPDLLSIKNASTESKLDSRSHNKTLQQLFSISSLEMLLKKLPSNQQTDLYLEFFNKVISSNAIVPFDTFNHPISQIFVINFEEDTVDYLRSKIVNFRNCTFPQFFQIEDLIFHAFVLYDETKVTRDDIQAFESSIKERLSIGTTFIPITSNSNENKELVKIYCNENTTIDEDLQRLTFDSSTDYFLIPQKIDQNLRAGINLFIAHQLIPHMERKVRIWDDQILAPKRSIANRFFSVSRKLFNNGPGDSQTSTSAYNNKENYYHKTSSEQAIRKLADWAVILKDFKYSYSIYDFIKKDFNNDKAWVYVASAQEMCIISLLLVQTQLSGQLVTPDKNTLRKIRHDIIEPYLDNLTYTYKSRLNLKTYNMRTLLVVSELLLCMCSTFGMYWWWVDLIEKYLVKSAQEFDNHLIASNQPLQVIKAIIYERIGYVFGKYSIESVPHSRHSKLEEKEKPEQTEEGFYKNPYKLLLRNSPCNNGLSRFRKSSAWYLLSMREWLQLKRYAHIKELLDNTRYTFDPNITDNWYDRSDLALGFVKRSLEEADQQTK